MNGKSIDRGHSPSLAPDSTRLLSRSRLSRKRMRAVEFRHGLWESGRMYRAGFLPFLALACAGLINARPAAEDLAGDWMGTLGSGAEKLRLKLHVIKTYDGLYI